MSTEVRAKARTTWLAGHRTTVRVRRQPGITQTLRPGSGQVLVPFDVCEELQFRDLRTSQAPVPARSTAKVDHETSQHCGAEDGSQHPRDHERPPSRNASFEITAEPRSTTLPSAANTASRPVLSLGLSAATSRDPAPGASPMPLFRCWPVNV